ncbi:MAG: RNA polymerase sigma factor [Candidatus Zixiibacteriota bacterium]
MNTSEKEDRGLVEGFLAGRKEEYQTISKWISRVVQLSSWGLNKYSDDITQDVLLKLYNSLKENKFRFASSLKTYVYRIAKFTCIDYLRKYSSREQKEIELIEIRGDNDPEEEMQKKEERKILWRIYRLISVECRELWKMIFWEDLSYLQIAQKLSIKEGTVKSRFARCKEKAVGLRKKLTEKGEPF